MHLHSGLCRGDVSICIDMHTLYSGPYYRMGESGLCPGPQNYRGAPKSLFISILKIHFIFLPKF